MLVHMVCIRHMRMRMPQHRVAMHMAVGPDGHGIVGVSMVAVIVHMGMFVSDCLMVVFMVVYFSQVNHYAQQHEHATDQQPSTS